MKDQTYMCSGFEVRTATLAATVDEHPTANSPDDARLLRRRSAENGRRSGPRARLGTAIRIWLANLLVLVSGAVWAQQATFDSGTGLLTLPAVKVGTATYTSVLLNLIDPANYTFRLASATAQDPPGPADITFDAGTGIVTIPSVAVGSAAYSVTLQLTDLSTYTFVLATATLIPPATWTFSQIQANVFTPRCSGCHDGSPGGLPGAQDLTAGNAYASIVNVPSLEQPALMRVKPGDPDNSYLIRKLQGTVGISGVRMPYGGPYLDQATIDQIRAWIANGAVNN